MSATTKPSARYRWRDREGKETAELQQLRKLRALGQRMGELAEAFGLTPDSMRSICGKYRVHSPRTVLQGEAGPYRPLSALDRAQPAAEIDPTDLPVPSKPLTPWDEMEAALDWQERRDQYREEALARRELQDHIHDQEQADA